jgi:molybdate transport system substrate-binding protein
LTVRLVQRAFILLSLGVACLAVLACGRVDSAEEASEALMIAAAASMKPALEDLIAAYREIDPALRIEATYSASGSLYGQMRHQAPFDIFYSADSLYPRELVNNALASEATLRVYARGRLAVWSARGSGVNIAAAGPEALTDASVSHIAIANPRHAPYGRAAREALSALGLLAAIEPKLVTGENVEQAAHFAHSRAAQAAFIPLTLARSPTLQRSGEYWLVPAELHQPLDHTVVILSAARNAAAAAAFDRFVAGMRGEEILLRHGLEAAGE